MNTKRLIDTAKAMVAGDKDSKIYLIRRGETEWSLSGQYTARTDLPLTVRGEAAARKVGERLNNVSFARVLV